MKYRYIYLPFVFLCENNIKNHDESLYKTYDKKKNYLEKINGGFFKVINDDIYRNNPEVKMFENKKLTEFYKRYARYIGYNYDDNEMIDYKSEWYGCNVLRIGQFEPSSKMCSCGVINKELKLISFEFGFKDEVKSTPSPSLFLGDILPFKIHLPSLLSIVMLL